MHGDDWRLLQKYEMGNKSTYLGALPKLPDQQNKERIDINQQQK